MAKNHSHSRGRTRSRTRNLVISHHLKCEIGRAFSILQKMVHLLKGVRGDRETETPWAVWFEDIVLLDPSFT